MFAYAVRSFPYPLKDLERTAAEHNNVRQTVERNGIDKYD